MDDISDIGDFMMRFGGVGEDVPDEMFEDILHSHVRLRDDMRAVEDWFRQNTTPPSQDLVDRAAIFGGSPFDLDWDDEEEITQPIGLSAEDLEQLRAQRKRDGVCPECGDKSKERSVGVCSVHGKFF